MPAPVIVALHIVEACQRTQQAQQGALVVAGGLGQLGQGEVFLGGVEGLEHRQCPLHGLDAVLCHLRIEPPFDSELLGW